MYGNTYQGDAQLLEEAVFPKILSKITNDFSWVCTQKVKSKRTLSWWTYFFRRMTPVCLLVVLEKIIRKLGTA